MKPYSALGETYRCDPCQEYPGKWILFLPLPYEGKTEHSFSSKEEAMEAGERIVESWEREGLEYDYQKVSVGWKCSDNDPRVGQVWFTGFYISIRMKSYGWVAYYE